MLTLLQKRRLQDVGRKLNNTLPHSIMKLAESIKVELLTGSQIRCKITSATKHWINVNGYSNKITVRFIRGTYHLDNCGNYMLSAKYILEQATGFEFMALNGSMARLVTKID
jgi:hypothetical protein